MALTAAERQRRSRAHRAGRHDLCDRYKCQEAPDDIVTPVVTVTFGLARTVKAGDRKRALEAIRDNLADMLEAETGPRDAAVLSRELRALMVEVASLDKAPAEKSNLDELERRRAARQVATG